MPKKKVIPAVFYARVSGDSQTGEDRHGFERQKEAVLAFCEAARFEIVAEYYEKAVSGMKGLEERPAFQEMLEFLLGNGCRAIVVESMDRLAREYRVQEQILIYLSSKGLSLIAANTGENITEAIAQDPMRKALVQIQGIFSELDKSLLVRKLRKARQAKRAKGERCEGRKPYGTHQGESETLKRIKELHRKPRKGRRHTLRAIAETLNEEGHRNRSGGLWTAGNVWSVLKR